MSNEKTSMDSSVQNFRKMLDIYRALTIRACDIKTEDGDKTQKILTEIEEKTKLIKITGQGYKGDAIQKYIEDCCLYDFGRFTVNIQSGRPGSCYLCIGENNINYDKADDSFIVSLLQDKSTKKINYNEVNDVDKLKAFMESYKEFFVKHKNDSVISLLKQKKSIILQGAPGTGKTYIVDELIGNLCGEYSIDHKAYIDFRENNRFTVKDTKYEGRIAFCTFHQSMEYEDFIEGIKPKTENGSISYKIEKGIFWHIATAAMKNYSEAVSSEKEPDPYILVIDEINRGNVSKIFGELITLLEAGKRKDQVQPISVTLPYSKERFELSPNLYIIGTMNTTDRSVGNLDYAVRRRFGFITMKSDRDVLSSYYSKTNNEDLGKTALGLFDQINGDEGFIKKNQLDEEMDLEDLKIGHSYFMAGDPEEFKRKMQYEVIPLLKEYIKDGLLRKPKADYFKDWQNGKIMSSMEEQLSDYYKNKEPGLYEIALAIYEQIYGESSVFDIPADEDSIKIFKQPSKEKLKAKIGTLIDTKLKPTCDDPEKEKYFDAWKKLETIPIE